MNDVITIDRLRMGVALQVSDVLAKSLEIDKYRDASIRATTYSISGYFASRQIYEKEQVISRSLSWRDRIRALFGKDIPLRVTVQMRHNCPHLQTDDKRTHVSWMVPR